VAAGGIIFENLTLGNPGRCARRNVRRIYGALKWSRLWYCANREWWSCDSLKKLGMQNGVNGRGKARPNCFGLAFLIVAFVTVYGGVPAWSKGEVGGAGTLLPRGGVIYIVGPTGSRVEMVMVEPDAEVKQGEVLLVLSERDILMAEKKLADQEYEALSQKSDDLIRIQKLAADGANLQLDRTKRELTTYRSLDPIGISQVELTKRTQAVEEAKLNSKVEQVKLEKLKKEIALEMKRAQLRREQAEARLSKAVVVAPRDGTILEIRKRAGETLGQDAAIVLGDLRTMYAVTDIYEGDLVKLEDGMTATITSESLKKTLTGVVEHVGRLIDTNTRLAKVTIRIDKAEWARRFVGMKVRVTIHTEAPKAPAEEKSAKPAAREKRPQPVN